MGSQYINAVYQAIGLQMKKTVLSHFYNEEYLLPWWLQHHKQIFDHGIMIDYHSTDRSVEIIKEICPTWEIVTSRNMDFQADNVDYEVMDIERNIKGWRMCINTPEFLIGDYSILTDAPNQQFVVGQTIFIDTDRTNIPTYDKPLWEQKNQGFTYKEDFKFRRGRSIHNKPVQYPVPGKHYEYQNTDALCMFYFGWAPLTEEQFKRKLQIQTQIPLHDRQRNWGFHNITNRETLEYKIENELIPKSHSLQEEIDYYVTKHKSTANLL